MIPKKILNKILEQDWYKKCCRCGRNKVELHHVYIYKGRQIQEEFNIVPACKSCHEQATPHNNRYKPHVRYYFEWIAYNRMDGEDFIKYGKKNWVQLGLFLNSQKEKYGWENIKK